MEKLYDFNVENIYLSDWEGLKFPESASLRVDNGRLILDISQDDIRIGEAHIEVCLIEKGLVETIKKQMKELQDKLHRRNMQIKELKQKINRLQELTTIGTAEARKEALSLIANP